MDCLPLKLRPTVKEIPRNLKKPSIEIELKEIDKEDNNKKKKFIYMNTNFHTICVSHERNKSQWNSCPEWKKTWIFEFQRPDLSLLLPPVCNYQLLARWKYEKDQPCSLLLISGNPVNSDNKNGGPWSLYTSLLETFFLKVSLFKINWKHTQISVTFFRFFLQKIGKTLQDTRQRRRPSRSRLGSTSSCCNSAWTKKQLFRGDLIFCKRQQNLNKVERVFHR